MEDKYLKLIEALAEKLGTTAEHLWGVLVKQAPISGAVDIAQCIVIASVAVWWVRLVMNNTKCPPKTDENRYPDAKWDGEGVFFAWVSIFIVVGISLNCVIGSSQEIVAAFANPEYWALKQLVK